MPFFSIFSAFGHDPSDSCGRNFPGHCNRSVHRSSQQKVSSSFSLESGSQFFRCAARPPTVLREYFCYHASLNDFWSRHEVAF